MYSGLMNMRPGGKQPAMHNTVWQGKEYSMVFNLGVPKGLLEVGEGSRHTVDVTRRHAERAG